MRPAQAIKTCLKKSFTWKGRAARPEFWWYAVFAVTVSLLLGYLNRLLPSAVWVQVPTAVVMLVVLLPLPAAGARRLQDTGEDGSQILYPLAPFLLAMLYHASISGSGALLGFIIIFAPYLFLALLLGFALVTLFLFSSVVGQLLVSSEPSANRYGPNPYEVLI